MSGFHSWRMVLLASCGILVLVSCTEDRAERYADLTAARAGGVIARGWVPEVLPPDAKNIEVTYNLDTNRCRFSFTSTVWGTLVPNADLETVAVDHLSGANRSWLQSLNLADAVVHVHRDSQHGTLIYFAHSPESPRVEAWHAQ